MTIQVSYMGTKRQIAPAVANIIEEASPGPLLDLFSGICAVGSEVSTSRQIWCNDIQYFATAVGRAFFKSKDLPITSLNANDLVFGLYLKNKKSLCNRFKDFLLLEDTALKNNRINKIKEIEMSFPHLSNSRVFEKERKRLSNSPQTFPYRLFSLTFAGGYFGLSQAIEIDSLRYAVDFLFNSKKISKDQHQWLILALCQAVCKTSTTTGHFAQYIKVKPNNKIEYFKQRNRSIWQSWLSSLDILVPIGSWRWRKKNKIFQKEAFDLLKLLKNKAELPSVIYADPPYTDDQYSRYYHLYETLIRYDYPTANGIGRYRPDRFTSPFSSKRMVEKAMEELIKGCSVLGSTLVLSYPDKGLLPNSKEFISKILKKYYRSYEIKKDISHFHSSLGCSKGLYQNSVNELIFKAF